MRWDLLCPRCRVAKAVVNGLDELPTGAHCSTCNIDYGREFTQNVELSFEPAPGNRLVEFGEYCLFGPMSPPHVKAQIIVAPGQTRRFEGDFEPGEYRLFCQIDTPHDSSAVANIPFLIKPEPQKRTRFFNLFRRSAA